MKTNRKGLTKKQAKVMLMYNNYIKTYGYPPTYEHMAEKLGITGPGVYYHMKKIIEKGLIADIDMEIQQDRNILDRIEYKLDTILSIINPSEGVFTAHTDESTFTPIN